MKTFTLYCLPCAGASATMYFRWRRLLPSWVTLKPIELPGRGHRLNELPQENFATLTRILCEEIALTRSERFAVFGHSMGALLAFGITQNLHKRNLPLPEALLISACPAPVCHENDRYQKLQTESDLIAELNKQGGTPREVFDNSELLGMTIELLRLDYRVCGSFQYSQSASLPVPIYGFAGRSDAIEVSRLNGWQLESTKTFTLDWFDGGHFFLRQSEEWFMHILKKRLAQIEMGEVRSVSVVS